MDEFEFMTKVGMTLGDFVLKKLTKKYQTQQELENELSNILQIIGVDIDVKGLAIFLAKNGYITIVDTNILAADGFELGSKRGGFDFFNSSIFDNTGTGIRASGKGTGISGRGNVSIKRTKGGMEYHAG